MTSKNPSNLCLKEVVSSSISAKDKKRNNTFTSVQFSLDVHNPVLKLARTVTLPSLPSSSGVDKSTTRRVRLFESPSFVRTVKWFLRRLVDSEITCCESKIKIRFLSFRLQVMVESKENSSHYLDSKRVSVSFTLVSSILSSFLLYSPSSYVVGEWVPGPKVTRKN